MEAKLFVTYFCAAQEGDEIYRYVEKVFDLPFVPNKGMKLQFAPKSEPDLELNMTEIEEEDTYLATGVLTIDSLCYLVDEAVLDLRAYVSCESIEQLEAEIRQMCELYGFHQVIL
jgi:hypothetical protein